MTDNKKVLLIQSYGSDELVEALTYKGYDFVKIIKRDPYVDINTNVIDVVDLFDLSSFNSYKFKGWYREIYETEFLGFVKRIARCGYVEGSKFIPFQMSVTLATYYTYDELINRFFLYVSKIDQLLEDCSPDSVWFFSWPHFGADNLLMTIAKYKGLETLVFYQSLFADKFFFGSDVSKLFIKKESNLLNFNKSNIGDIKDLNLFYMKNVVKRSRFISFIKLFKSLIKFLRNGNKKKN